MRSGKALPVRPLGQLGLAELSDCSLLRFRRCKDDQYTMDQAGFDGLFAQLDTPTAVFTASPGHQEAQECYPIDQISVSVQCCNMRVYHTARLSDEHGREVGFGYSR